MRPAEMSPKTQEYQTGVSSDGVMTRREKAQAARYNRLVSVRPRPKLRSRFSPSPLPYRPDIKSELSSTGRTANGTRLYPSPLPDPPDHEIRRLWVWFHGERDLVTRSGGRILDSGCGAGLGRLTLAERGPSAALKPMAENLRRRGKGWSPHKPSSGASVTPRSHSWAIAR